MDTNGQFSGFSEEQAMSKQRRRQQIQKVVKEIHSF